MFRSSIKRNLFISILLIFTIFILYGCNVFKKDGTTENLEYKELKQMVTDILQTDESKKIIQNSIQDPNIKKEIVLNDDEVKSIVEKELLSPENKDKLKSMYEDPEFAAKLGETLKKENEKLLKDLMKDPEYRKMMIETMQNKEFEKIIMDIMKSNEYRSQMMLVIKESLQSPMFKNDLMKLMEEASKKAMQGEEKEGQPKENSQEQKETQK